jgi:hypothetical protein
MPTHRRPPRAGALTDLAPVGIIKKIIILQVAYYASATALILFTTLVAGKPFRPGLILSWRSIRGDNTIGWTLGLVWILNSLIGFVLLPKHDPRHQPLLTSFFSQGCLPPPPNLPLETHPRLRSHNPLRPPCRHIPLHSLPTHQLALVGSPSFQRRADDVSRNMGLPMAGTSADKLRWQRSRQWR